MSTSVTITGTGCPIPDASRAGPGALVRYNDLTMQFDVGRSTVQRLAGADVWIPGLTAVFITHHHSDHLTGLADLLLTHWIMDRTDAASPIPIIAPAGPSAAYVSKVFDGWQDDIDVRAAHAARTSRPSVNLQPFDVPESPTEVWRTGDVVVTSGQVRHEPCPSSVGYRVDTPDGSVAITGDTRVCDEVMELANGVDVLVYEAMRFSFFDGLPEHRQFVKDYHADSRLIGTQAAEMGVRTLVLTHLIPAPNSPDEKQAFVDDIRTGGFEGELVVADDLDTVVVGAAGLPDVQSIDHAAEQA